MIRGAKGDWCITQLPEVEGAFVALDPRTGAVRAMVGGFDYSKSKFNHVTQAWRQPGSSFKPFIYSAALEKGFTPATVINDAPLFFDAGTTGSQPWEPKNYDGTYDGPMTMRRGLAKSKNMISIRILKSIGPAYAQQWITRFGFDADKHPAYLPMALGAGAVTPLQMASAYSVFANGGYRVNPMLISRITDTQGPRDQRGARCRCSTNRCATIDARNAFVMTSLLQEVTHIGTAAKAGRALKRPDIYGKTGTTNDSLDAWFAGWQKNIVAVVWIGYDNPRKLGDRETGGGLALPVWIDYMKTVLKGVPVQEPTAARRRGQPERRVVLRGVRARHRRQQPRPRGQAAAGAAERGRAQEHPRPVPPLAAQPDVSELRAGDANSSALPGLRLAHSPTRPLKNSRRFARIDPAPADEAEVKPARTRRQPQLVQRRLGVEDDLAAVRERQFEQAAGAVRVDVDDVVLKPPVDCRFDARQHRGGARVVLGVGECVAGRSLVSWSIESNDVRHKRKKCRWPRSRLRPHCGLACRRLRRSACGQKGPLTLPSSSATTPATHAGVGRRAIDDRRTEP